MTTLPLSVLDASGYYWLRYTPKSPWQMSHINLTTSFITFCGSASEVSLLHIQTNAPTSEVHGPLTPPNQTL